MIKILFTQEEIETIKHDRFYHPHPRVQIKMEVLHLHSFGLKQSLICKIAGVSPNTIRSYLKQFLNGGLDEIKTITAKFSQILTLSAKISLFLLIFLKSVLDYIFSIFL